MNMSRIRLARLLDTRPINKLAWAVATKRQEADRAEHNTTVAELQRADRPITH